MKLTQGAFGLCGIALAGMIQPAESQNYLPQKMSLIRMALDITLRQRVEITTAILEGMDKGCAFPSKGAEDNIKIAFCRDEVRNLKAMNDRYREILRVHLTR